MQKWGATRLADSRDLEVQRENHFELQLVGNGNVDFGEDFTISVESFPLPTETSEQLEVPYGNTTVNLAGRVSWGAGALVVRDFVDKKTKAILIDWRSQCYNHETDQVGRASDYKTQGYVYEYSVDGQLTGMWELQGVWPQEVNYGNLTHQSGERKNIEANLVYDKCTPIEY